MRNSLKYTFRIGREYLTHWIAAGLILAATGAAPEHWLLTRSTNCTYRPNCCTCGPLTSTFASCYPDWASH